MTKFIFKSNASDLQKIIAINETIQKNVLYLTYRTDMILKIIKEQQTDKGLQKQVDEYFDQDPFGSAFSESVKQGSKDPED